MKILITGDFVINNKYDKSNISDDILSLFSDSDLNIVNLEAPVTTSFSKIKKTGPHLKADPDSTFNILKALNINLVTLANNHILDYGEQGIIETIEFCKENNIKTTGAGKNLKEASQILYLQTLNEKIAIINFAENEWASASEKKAGANPMNLIENIHQIKEAKKYSDFVFVIVHGGHEFYNLPSPRMQKQYRFYAENGANIVIGHHPHCISGYELFQDTPIYYSLGNFLFTKENDIHNDWYIGAALEINTSKKALTTKIHLIKQEKKTFKISLLCNQEKKLTLDRISNYNATISNKIKLKQEWEHFVDIRNNKYLNFWSPTSFIRNKYLQKALQKMRLRLLNEKGIALYLNLIRCESHKEISEAIMRNFLQKKN